jgi:WD40 repeat protein
MGQKSTGGHRLFLLSILALTACGGGSTSDGASGGGGTPPGAGGINYTVGGTVSGLSGTAVLQNNGGNNLLVLANSSFVFAGVLADASAYKVTVLTQPSGQTCTVANGAGIVGGANVTNVTLTCSATAFSVGGTVSGLSGSMVLRNNGGNDLAVSANGNFSFPAPFAQGSPYAVTVFTQPAGRSCSVANGTGTVAGASVTNVTVTCAANAFTVGGTVSGLNGTVVLQNNGGDNLTISANGGFTFAVALLDTSPYAVTVLTQSAGQACMVVNGAGTLSGANVTGVTVTCPPPEARLGQWSAVSPAPIVQLHIHLLDSGKVLTWGADGTPRTWDPASGAFTVVPSPSLLFCSGHAFLPDGRLLVAGGHKADALDTPGLGLPNTNIFDPATGAWQAMPAMAKARWYPTNTRLPNGEVVTIAGSDENGVNVLIPEVWNGTAWRQLTSAALELPLYPRTFVAPDGRIFYAGEDPQSRYLDVTGTGHWTNGPFRKVGGRDYGSAVMYEPGKILYVGGGDPATNTAEIIDLNQTSPTWSFTGGMASARRHLNATLLPTGDVLVTGGTNGPGFNNPAGGVRTAELWHPASGTWTTLASSSVIRIYHGAALLLPDGRVLYTGSGDGGDSPNERNYELYSPPYLFNGARPAITGALPSSVGYGQAQIVATPDGPGITKVTLIGLGSVTHAFDQSARLVPLSFSPAAKGLSITLPASPTIAPPGPYMLFLVNADGVPSAGRIMLLQ